MCILYVKPLNKRFIVPLQKEFVIFGFSFLLVRVLKYTRHYLSISIIIAPANDLNNTESQWNVFVSFCSVVNR